MLSVPLYRGVGPDGGGAGGGLSDLECAVYLHRRGIRHLALPESCRLFGRRCARLLECPSRKKRAVGSARCDLPELLRYTCG